ncbi:polyprenol monophosphomannose synthase [Chitinophaga caseinilytica]|uniref:polyprenol monophosphomannose synthase n=1 Tax=Chitinophaga caseinilytica TaxID=2267521 RepID=UPI003C30E5FA
MEKLVIIPTYNEKDNIARMIETVFSLQQGFHILIVDDGSPDGTGAIVKGLQQQYPGQLFIEERSGKQGLGTAYIHGFRWALQRSYQFIFEMDADFSHNPKDLIRLYEACAKGGADLSVGSRYVPGGKTENWPWNRAVLSYGASVYVRLITWMPVKDATAGFVCYTRKVLETMNLGDIRFVGYAFQIEMKFTAWKLGFRIAEVPITFIDRKEGYSKMSKGIVKEGIFGVLKIQWHSLFGKRR